METKEEFIKATIQQLLRIANKYALVEELPLRFNGGEEVTTREAHVIQAIGESSEMNITGLANRFGITKSAASQMVAKLVKKGFVVKKQAPHSNKEFFLSLSKTGVQVFNAHEQAHGKDMAYLIDRLGAFSFSQIATLAVLLEAIGGVMDERLSNLMKE
jgi:DNA-binding MarR family transcriptional regulator